MRQINHPPAPLRPPATANETTGQAVARAQRAHRDEAGAQSNGEVFPVSAEGQAATLDRSTDVALHGLASHPVGHQAIPALGVAAYRCLLSSRVLLAAVPSLLVDTQTLAQTHP